MVREEEWKRGICLLVFFKQEEGERGEGLGKLSS